MSNDFLTFGTDAGANVLTQAEYASLASRSSGFASGTAVSKQLNKAWRQSSVMSHVLAAFIETNSGHDVLDNGDVATIKSNLALAIKAAVSGYIPYASVPEALALSATDKVISPYLLGQVLNAKLAQATTADLGVVRLATAAQVSTGTDSTRAVTPASLTTVYAKLTGAALVDATTNSTPPPNDNSNKLVNTNYVFTELARVVAQATESVPGIMALATTAEASAGVNATKAMTPAKTAPLITAALNSTMGYNRTYVNATASRTAGVTYTNTNLFPIVVVVSIVTQPGVDTATVTVGSTVVYTGDLGVSGMVVPVTFAVGNGQTYKVDVSGGATIQRWVEMV